MKKMNIQSGKSPIGIVLSLFIGVILIAAGRWAVLTAYTDKDINGNWEAVGADCDNRGNNCRVLEKALLGNIEFKYAGRVQLSLNSCSRTADYSIDGKNVEISGAGYKTLICTVIKLSSDRMILRCEDKGNRAMTTVLSLKKVVPDLSPSSKEICDKAAAAGDLKALSAQMDKKCGKNVNILSTCCYLNSALFKAAENEREKAVRFLLEQGADPYDAGAFEGQGILNLMTIKNNIKAVEILLKSGVDPNHDAGKNPCPLHLAVKNNNLKMASLLLANGADINARDGSAEGATPLSTAIVLGNCEIAEFLVKKGADLYQYTGLKDDWLCGGVPFILVVRKYRGESNPSTKEKLERLAHTIISMGLDVNYLHPDNPYYESLSGYKCKFTYKTINDDYRCCPLIIAAIKAGAPVSIISAMISKGADPCARCCGNTMNYEGTSFPNTDFPNKEVVNLDTYQYVRSICYR